MARASNLTMCSFCGKSHSEVKKLIAGPGVYICNECIDVCSNILEKELGTAPAKGKTSAEKPGFKIPSPAAMLAKLNEFVIGQENAKKVLSVAVYNHCCSPAPPLPPWTSSALPPLSPSPNVKREYIFVKRVEGG